MVKLMMLQWYTLSNLSSKTTAWLEEVAKVAGSSAGTHIGPNKSNHVAVPQDDLGVSPNLGPHPVEPNLSSLETSDDFLEHGLKEGIAWDRHFDGVQYDTWVSLFLGDPQGGDGCPMYFHFKPTKRMPRAQEKPTPEKIPRNRKSDKISRFRVSEAIWMPRLSG